MFLVFVSSAILLKVEDAFKNFCYVPYSSLTLASCTKVAWGEEDLVPNALGGLTVKSLERRNEKAISIVDWHAAAHAAEERTWFHHGEACAEALSVHHRLVMDLGHTHSWDIAMDYDVQQRNAVALNPAHDLSSMDLTALTIIATCPVVSTAGPPLLSPKRGIPSDALAQPPCKRQHSHCFCCGGPDHFPANCQAEVTATGKSIAKLAPTAKSKHAMLATNGKQFCFSWARSSSCSFGSSCSNFHGCSICSEVSHGAGGCKAHT